MGEYGSWYDNEPNNNNNNERYITLNFQNSCLLRQTIIVVYTLSSRNFVSSQSMNFIGLFPFAETKSKLTIYSIIPPFDAFHISANASFSIIISKVSKT